MEAEQPGRRVDRPAQTVHIVTRGTSCGMASAGERRTCESRVDESQEGGVGSAGKSRFYACSKAITPGHHTGKE